MADRVRRTLPSVFPPLFLLYTHASTIGGYSSLCPPPTPPQMRFKRALNGIFQLPHDSLSTLCFSPLLSDAQHSQSASVPSAQWHKGYFWRMHCKTQSMEHTPQQMGLLCARMCLCVRWLSRQRNQALTPCDRASGARQGCPAVTHWRPQFSLFYTLHRTLKS